MAKEDLYLAECGSLTEGTVCTYSQKSLSEQLAKDYLDLHFKTAHDADLTEPSRTIYGWVRPDPPPPRFTRRPRGGDNLNVR